MENFFITPVEQVLDPCIDGELRAVRTSQWILRRQVDFCVRGQRHARRWELSEVDVGSLSYVTDGRAQTRTMRTRVRKHERSGMSGPTDERVTRAIASLIPWLDSGNARVHDRVAGASPPICRRRKLQLGFIAV